MFHCEFSLTNRAKSQIHAILYFECGLLFNEPVAPSLAGPQPGSKTEVAVAAGTDPEPNAAGTTQDAEE